jgi:CheY-like chemotaxis protein
MTGAQQTLSIPALLFLDEPKALAKNSWTHADKTQRLEDLKKVRVIVIDDEALIADTVVEILKDEGFEATAVSTGNSAIELARDWHPDIVLSDVILPGLNGIEVGIKIREMVPACKIILFSGQAATLDLVESAREKGHKFDILAKPIKPETLVHLIRGQSNLPS